ncbi:SepM family pheromone-processing serine protease [Gracilibacillus sp. YIM 98692]|uniref:SepM family pheromone-processing serine protease n=1 Tax=Gracilibacillus sp. YIM 98692 TaxID=2663532 RepID=UPI0013D3D41A|nr:SepM family pheromone-processing serine protease [Gracilibacillus sp. YIM 98692]
MLTTKNKGKIVVFLMLLIGFYMLFGYQLPYYIHKPGHADPLNPVIEVEGSFDSRGDMHLVTIQGGQASLFQYMFAKIRPYHDILPIEDVLSDGITKDEYRQLQFMMMESSQEASTVVAYQAAGKDISINYEGVYVVSVKEGVPADGVLESGDKVIRVNQKTIKEAEDLLQVVSSHRVGDEIEVTVERDDHERTYDIELKAIEELDGKPGIGIRLVTNREVTESPEIHFSSGDIGGPSAGLMFALEIYDQLTDQDLTKGYPIAGTGEIDYDGNVGPIGGVDKKVIAADREGCAYFFAPNQRGMEGSNYQVAKKVAEEIGTDMEIVPVDHFDDAVEFLHQLAEK